MGIWGWSFGGYATTHSLLFDKTTFTTGVAVAPLVSRFNYDSMHTERFMDLPENNQLNYTKCSIVEQNLDNIHLVKVPKTSGWGYPYFLEGGRGRKQTLKKWRVPLYE